MTEPVQETVEEMAAEYTKVISEPQYQNGLGQHVHPKYGVTHTMLMIMTKRYGAKETNDAITAAFQARKALKMPDA